MQLRLKLHRLESNGAVSNSRLGAKLLPNVEFAGVVQSTWKSHMLIRSVAQLPEASSHMLRYESGAPDGGLNPSAPPSASEGSRLSNPVPRWKYTERAGCPASIAARSNATTPTPV